MKVLFAIAFAAIVLSLSVPADAGHKRQNCGMSGASGYVTFCKGGGAKWRFADHQKKRKRRNKDHDNARDAVKTGKVLPLSNIWASVRRKVPGKLLDANLGRAGNRYVYSLKVRDNRNRIKVVRVDAVSGRILSMR